LNLISTLERSTAMPDFFSSGNLLKNG